MSSELYLPTVIRYLDHDGRQVRKGTPGARRVRRKSNIWRGRYRDAEGCERTVALQEDRELSRLMLADIRRRIAHEKAGIVPPTDPFATHRSRPLPEHLADWERTLRSRRRSDKHIFKLTSYVRRIAEACGWTTLADISADDAEHHLHERRQQGLSIAGSNDHIAALKNFGSWLTRSRPKRASENPFSCLSKLNAAEDVRLVRRPATPDELRRLISAAKSQRPYRGLTGSDRSVLYLVASETGFRASELASLTIASLDLDSSLPTITVEAAYSKRRRRDVQPIRREVASTLRGWPNERRMF